MHPLHDLRQLLQKRDAGNALLSFGGADLVDAGAFGFNGDGDGHLVHIKLVDGFHGEVFKSEQARAAIRLDNAVF